MFAETFSKGVIMNDNIEITEEMLFAGQREMLCYDPDNDPPRELVERIYRAMEEARKEFHQASKSHMAEATF